MGLGGGDPFWYLMTFLPWRFYSSLVVMFGDLHWRLSCHQTAKDMGAATTTAVLFGDEFVGMWITLMALSRRRDWQGGCRVRYFPRILDM